MFTPLLILNGRRFDQTIQWISQLTSASKIKIERLDPTGQTVSTMNNVLNTGSYVMTIPFDATLGRYRYRLSLEAGLINNPQTPPQKIVSWHHAWDEDPANISAIAESGFLLIWLSITLIFNDDRLPI